MVTRLSACTEPVVSVRAGEAPGQSGAARAELRLSVMGSRVGSEAVRQ